MLNLSVFLDIWLILLFCVMFFFFLNRYIWVVSVVLIDVRLVIKFSCLVDRFWYWLLVILENINDWLVNVLKLCLMWLFFFMMVLFLFSFFMVLKVIFSVLGFLLGLLVCFMINLLDCLRMWIKIFFIVIVVVFLLVKFFGNVILGIGEEVLEVIGLLVVDWVVIREIVRIKNNIMFCKVFIFIF